MDEIPAHLLKNLAEADWSVVREWWVGLSETARSEIVWLCDERQEECFFGVVPKGDSVPSVIGGRFIPHDDAWGLSEWGPGYFEHLLQHPELVIDWESGRRTFHIGCTQHPAARACLTAGCLPADFKCPLGLQECPMQRLLAIAPNHNLQLIPAAARVRCEDEASKTLRDHWYSLVLPGSPNIHATQPNNLEIKVLFPSHNSHGGVVQTRLSPGMLLSGLFLMGPLGGAAPPSTPEPKPQNPIVEDIHFRHGDNRLAGTLFRPTSPGPHPAVALVLGSGAQDRAYGGAGTALGRHFARHGFVCLAWDKPGVGKSTGDYHAQTFRDRAEEALAAVRFLRERKDIHRDRVGLWGHSQGGTVAPLAAALSGEVAFVIEVAGWQGPPWQQDLARVEAELRADGFPEADVQKATAFARLRMDLIRGTGPFEDLDKAQEEVKGLPWFASVHRCDRALFDSARRILVNDTGPSWEKVRCPVLVIYGDKDTSTGPPEAQVAIIRRGLARVGNREVMEKIFPSADHSLCKTETGGPKEAAQRAKTRKKEDGPDFVAGYLDTMTTWLTKRFGPEP